MRQGPLRLRYVSHPHRLRPLIRKDNRPKVVDDDIDPGNPLTALSRGKLGEALDRAAGGCARSAIATARPRRGFGSAKGSNEEAYGAEDDPHRVRLEQRRPLHAAVPRLSVAALLENIGSGAVTAPFTAVKDADVIIVIGANPTENHPVAATYFKQAARQGKTLIVMDPRGQTLSAAPRMLQFKPGTDVSLLNALMHVIVEEELFDRQYIQAHTEGFENLREHLEYAGAQRDLRHRRQTLRARGAHLRHGAARDHLLGHGHQPARARDRQRAA